MTKRFAVVCPGGSATGGNELIHQCVDEINRHRGAEAFIHYIGPRASKGRPPSYKNYNCPSICASKISEEFVFIVPEVYTYYLSAFKKNRKFIWWLSVDNYINSRGLRFWLANRLWPLDYWHASSERGIAAPDGHIVQSEYARLFLESRGIKHAVTIGDYINGQFLSTGHHSTLEGRADRIVYNPAKGLERIERLMRVLPKVEFTPLIKMGREEIIDLFSNSKIYVDLGNHPGKDRIPREAASQGVCVFTNLRGSAGNEIDVPVGGYFKIDDERVGFEEKLSARVCRVFKEFRTAHRAQRSYREKIFREPAEFRRQVLQFIDSI